MSKAKHQGLEEEREGPRDGAGDIRALLGEVREQMEEVLRLQFAQAEKTIASRVAERLAGADALIARLTSENARLTEENARHERTLARLRELALSGP